MLVSPAWQLCKYTNLGVKLDTSILKTEEGPVHTHIANKYLKAVKAGWKTWEFAKLQSAYVDSQGWKAFHRDLVLAVRKTYKDFKE